MIEITIQDLKIGDKVKTSFNNGYDFVEKINLNTKKIKLKHAQMEVRANDKGFFIKLD